MIGEEPRVDDAGLILGLCVWETVELVGRNGASVNINRPEGSVYFDACSYNTSRASISRQTIYWKPYSLCSPLKENLAVIPAVSAPVFVWLYSAGEVTLSHPFEYVIPESRSSTTRAVALYFEVDIGRKRDGDAYFPRRMAFKEH